MTSLPDLMATFEARRVSITVYASASESSIDDWFGTSRVDVTHRRLPDDAPGFLVVRDPDGFVASIPLETVRALAAPTIGDPWDAASAAERAFYDAFAGTVLSSLERRQLLAVAREIERRARAAGTGELRVGFQSLSAMADQVPVYARLGAETDLEIHVYGAADWNPPTIPNVTVHEESADEIGDFWFLAFDGGGEVGSGRACALLAEEVRPDAYRGFWTYDPDPVGELLEHLRETYG